MDHVELTAEEKIHCRGVVLTGLTRGHRYLQFRTQAEADYAERWCVAQGIPYSVDPRLSYSLAYPLLETPEMPGPALLCAQSYSDTLQPVKTPRIAGKTFLIALLRGAFDLVRRKQTKHN